MSFKDVNLLLNLLECRTSSYTIQYVVQSKTMKRILMTSPPNTEPKTYHRIILRSNRTMAFMKQERYFQSLGPLGSGSFGKVELVKSLTNHKYYALKSVKGSRSDLMENLHLVSLVERDCAVLLESDHFVKLKAAWLETEGVNNPDCFKFLWENMPYGDMDELLKQIHPMTSKDNSFSKKHANISFFSFHTGTCNSLTSDMDFDRIYKSNDILLRCLYSETLMITEGGKRHQIRHIIFSYLMQLVEAVTFMHQKNIRHHDLKPANILISKDLKLKVGDLGLVNSFAAQHIPEIHSWSNKRWLEENKNKRNLILGDAVQQANYYKDLCTQKQELRPRGTEAWQAPEESKTFYRFPKWSGSLFNSHVHRKADWYAVGIIAFQLLTGLHPIDNTLEFYQDELFDDFPDPTTREMTAMIKVDPKKFNPLLYNDVLKIKSKAFESLILDKRLHSLCVKLLHPSPHKRMDGHSCIRDSNCRALAVKTGYPRSPLPFTWNEFLRDPNPTKFETLTSRAREGRGTSSGDTKSKGLNIAQLPGFQLMTHSPGTIASPITSNRTLSSYRSSPSEPRPSSSSGGPVLSLYMRFGRI